MANSYTIVIVPDSKSNLRKFQISKKFLFFALTLFAALVMTGLGTVINYARKQAQNYEKLQKENLRLKNNLKDSQILTAKLMHKISNLTHLSARLRSIAGLPQSAQKKPATKLGMGGATLGSRLKDSPSPETLLTLQEKADVLEGNLKMLDHFFEDRKAIPSLVPTQGLISSTFGARTNPFTGLPDFHEGLDISADIGTPVVATADGVVTFAGFRGNFGRVVEIGHEYGFSTVFGHLAEIDVHAGQQVHRGEVIGLVGNSGNSTGPHLHYEVHVNDQAVNPKPYLLDGVQTAQQ
jgi:Membrane proteins related to metalloendopeptidases